MVRIEDLRSQGQMLGELANEFVRMQVEHYGKGPAEAKAYFCDDFLICAMKDGVTTAERTMLEGDDQEVVRDLRLRYQRQMEGTFKEAVERIARRRVLSYHSQIVFDPDYVFEVFVLGEELGAAPGEKESRSAA